MAVLTVSEPTFCIPSFRSAFVAPFTGREPVEFLAFSSHCVVGQPEGKVWLEDAIVRVHRLMGNLKYLGI